MAAVIYSRRITVFSLAIAVAANANVVPINSLARKVKRTQLREILTWDYSACAFQALFAPYLAIRQNRVSETDYPRVARESISGNPDVQECEPLAVRQQTLTAVTESEQ